MAEKAKTARKPKDPPTPLNAVPKEKLQRAFSELDKLHNKLEEDSAGTRSKIGKEYERIVADTGLTKTVMMFAYRVRRRAQKDELKARKMNTEDRDSLEQIAQTWGAVDEGFGQYLMDKAKLAGSGPGIEE